MAVSVSSPLDPPGSPGSATTASPRWLLALLTLALTLAAFRPTDSVVDVSLDSSNVATYAWFKARGAHFGSEVISVVGPYGFVHYGYSYAGELYWLRFALELALKAAFASLVVWLFATCSRRFLRWVWIATIVLILPLVEDTVYDITLLLAVLFLLRPAIRPRSDWSSYAVVVLLTFLSLTKSTQIVLSVIGMGMVVIAGWSDQRQRSLRLLAMFVVSYLTLWLCAGQRLTDLPAFFRGVLELSGGFNGAMGLEETRSTFALGILVFVSLAATCIWILVAGGFARAHVLAGVWLGGFTFVMWKHGFVRADGHVMFFFDFAVVSALVPWLILGRDKVQVGRGVHATGLAFSTLALLLAGYSVLSSRTSAQWFETFRYAAKIRIDQLSHPQRHREALEARLQQQRARFDLPRVRNAIGDRSVDFFGYEQGYVLLNQFNYRPRPMGGGTFSVYNEYLKRRNEEFVTDAARRPEFYLLKLDRLDQRLVSQEDSRAFLQLLYHYRPVAAEHPTYLLQQRQGSAVPPDPIEFAHHDIKWNEAIAVPTNLASPEDLILLTFSADLNWRGHVRGFLYKPPEIFLELTGDPNMTVPKVRLVPAMARSPILLSPLVEDAHDFVQLCANLPGKSVTAFRLTSMGSELYDPSSLSVKFYRLPRPLTEPLSREVFASAHFPPANIAPEFDDHKSNPHTVDGELADSFHAPARAVFPLNGRETEIAFRFGIEEGAYTSGETDGAELIVELVQRPGEKATSLFRRLLQPKTVESDRGTLAAVIPLPIVRPGAKLILRAEAGPRNDAAWDWVYVSRFEVSRGQRSHENFPGFKTLPATVDSAFAAPNQGPNGQAVFSLNAPGEMVFDLAYTARFVAFTGGFLPGAYSGEGNTDGAEFVVTLRRQNGETVELASPRLDPRSHPADRQPFDLRLELPDHQPGDQLILRTEPGPTGDESWDWTYVTNVHIN